MQLAAISTNSSINDLLKELQEQNLAAAQEPQPEAALSRANEASSLQTSSSLMSGNFADSASQPSKYIAAKMKSFQAKSEVSNQLAGTLESAMAEIDLLMLTRKNMSRQTAARIVARRTQERVSNIVSNQVVEKSAEQLEAERKAQLEKMQAELEAELNRQQLQQGDVPAGQLVQQGQAAYAMQQGIAGNQGQSGAYGVSVDVSV